jgi:hypothetical protein
VSLAFATIQPPQWRLSGKNVFVTSNSSRPDSVVHLDVQDASLEVLGNVDADAEEQDR